MPQQYSALAVNCWSAPARMLLWHAPDNNSCTHTGNKTASAMQGNAALCEHCECSTLQLRHIGTCSRLHGDTCTHSKSLSRTHPSSMGSETLWPVSQSSTTISVMPGFHLQSHQDTIDAVRHGNHAVRHGRSQATCPLPKGCWQQRRGACIRGQLLVNSSAQKLMQGQCTVPDCYFTQLHSLQNVTVGNGDMGCNECVYCSLQEKTQVPCSPAHNLAHTHSSALTALSILQHFIFSVCL